jgi:hypothetical protein
MSPGDTIGGSRPDWMNLTGKRTPMPDDQPMSQVEKRLVAHGLAQAVMFSRLMKLLKEKNIISDEESTELMQETALFFMKADATDIERMAADILLSVISR